MMNYKQIFPRYTIDTTTKNHMVWVKVDSPHRLIENRDENLKGTLPNLISYVCLF